MTRNRSELYYRHYPSAAKTATAIILLHGISEDSKYLFPYSQKVSSTGLAHVFTPDLRGYGPKAANLGDIDYIGQLEDDLADLIQYIKDKFPHVKQVVMAGHSAGGGTAIRFAGSRYADCADSYLLLTPYLGPGNPTERPADGHRKLHMGKVIILSMLDSIGIKGWVRAPRHGVVQAARGVARGMATKLSFRLLLSRSPMKYKRDLTKPTLVLVGAEDEVFYADRYEELLSTYTKAHVHIVPGANHDGLLESPIAYVHTANWLKSE
ncbi:Lysophospholipase, alpha-beta hydrolase superfamily [Paenibacillus sophorae]|uniref:Alpha/beta hydrolase n=1 Tax=Paenibacillus sophorae TaxID=1333845 RepID=A0A1H8SBM1_9BACL|nr:alpha/beta hydrolase [Paenibacillus sophorae]QWU16793.1 alpha/beta hydrolase [Paenibacillus sophorae]SEO75906.1 Lysophospholipase, alpha-beta hydrolase superfamily [Paenibacillus sophorae]